MSINVFIGSLLIGLFLEILRLFGGGDGDDGGDDWINTALFSRFLVGFGSSGILLGAWQEWIGEQFTYIIAGIIGIGFALLLRKLLRFISKSGNPSVDTISFEGMEGVVITPIREGQPGEISVMGNQKKYFLKAYSLSEERFFVGDKVCIVDNNNNTVQIKRKREDD